jgi:hypothetical protein
LCEIGAIRGTPDRALLNVMAGLVPAIPASTVLRRMAGTSPDHDVTATSSRHYEDCCLAGLGSDDRSG